jgi:hypothetical protein
MNRKWHRLLALLLAAALLAPAPALAAPEAPKSNARVIIRVEKLLDALNNLDAWAGVAPGAPDSFSKPVRDKIMGGAWIDPARAVILSVGAGAGLAALKKGKSAQGAPPAGEKAPGVFAAVPFLDPNPAFQAQTNALVDTANKCYFLAIPQPPPGKQTEIPKSVREAMLRQANEITGYTLLAEVPVSRLAGDIKPALAALVEEAKTLAGKQGASGGKIKSGEKSIQALMSLANQVETVSLGLALSPADVSAVFSLKAERDTKLGKLFTAPPAVKSNLQSYRPSGAVVTRTRAMDTRRAAKEILKPLNAGMAEALGGMDCLWSTFGEFTGESVFVKDQEGEINQYLGMARLRGADAAKTFITGKLLPCMQGLGDAVQKAALQAGASKAANPFVPTKRTTVAGKDVYGFRWQKPRLDPGVVPPPMPFDSMEVRLAVQDDLLLVAPDDSRIAGLYMEAKVLEAQNDTGPTMLMEVDLPAYFKKTLGLEPKSPTGAALGKAVFGMTFNNRGADATWTVSVEDIKAVFANLGSIQAKWAERKALSGEDTDASAEGTAGAADETGPSLTAEDLRRQEVRALLAKADIVAVYGAHRHAVKYYTQALEKDPENARTYFALGLSQAELGMYDQALANINQAIKRSPKEPAYLFGRGRTLMLMGRTDEGMADVSKAAAMGDVDAREYLAKRKEQTKGR